MGQTHALKAPGPIHLTRIGQKNTETPNSLFQVTVSRLTLHTWATLRPGKIKKALKKNTSNVPGPLGHPLLQQRPPLPEPGTPSPNPVRTRTARSICHMPSAQTKVPKKRLKRLKPWHLPSFHPASATSFHRSSSARACSTSKLSRTQASQVSVDSIPHNPCRKEYLLWVNIACLQCLVCIFAVGNNQGHQSKTLTGTSGFPIGTGIHECNESYVTSLIFTLASILRASIKSASEIRLAHSSQLK